MWLCENVRWEEFEITKKNLAPHQHMALVVMWLDDSGFSFLCLAFLLLFFRIPQLNDKLSKKSCGIPLLLHISLSTSTINTSIATSAVARTTRSYTNFLFVWVIISLPNNPKKGERVALVSICVLRYWCQQEYVMVAAYLDMTIS